MNKVILTGRLTNDPEVRTSVKGTKLATFGVAVQRNFKNKEGKYEADFINCEAFNLTADFIDKYIKKGNKVALEGRLNTSQYEKDGQKLTSTKLLVDSIENLESKPKQDETPKTILTKSAFEEFGEEIALSDEDLPF